MPLRRISYGLNTVIGDGTYTCNGSGITFAHPTGDVANNTVNMSTAGATSVTATNSVIIGGSVGAGFNPHHTNSDGIVAFGFGTGSSNSVDIVTNGSTSGSSVSNSIWFPSNPPNGGNVLSGSSHATTMFSDSTGPKSTAIGNVQGGVGAVGQNCVTICGTSLGSTANGCTNVGNGNGSGARITQPSPGLNTVIGCRRQGGQITLTNALIIGHRSQAFADATVRDGCIIIGNFTSNNYTSNTFSFYGTASQLSLRTAFDITDLGGSNPVDPQTTRALLVQINGSDYKIPLYS
uniref:Uncharacterized protein n=1 Tax=viral metagenome TaxID=1070528 RepID=A0A6C0IV03_9ZZZZ